MRIPIEVGIAGMGISRIPQPIFFKELLRQGKISQELVDEEDYASVWAAPEGSKPLALAHDAVTQALQDAKIPASKVDAVFYASSFFKDKSCWSGAAAVCHAIGAPHAQFLDIYQGCNGVIAAVEIAISRMLLDESLQNVVVVAADIFPEKLSTKWDFDYGSFMGDGAGAWVVSRSAYKYRILSLNIHYMSWLNDMISVDIGSHADSRLTGRSETAGSLKPSKKAFLSVHGKDAIEKVYGEGTREIASRCTRQAGTTTDFAVIPNFGKRFSNGIVEDLSIPVTRTTWEIGRTLGHMGAADPIVNFSLASEAGVLGHAQSILFLTHGAGASIAGMMVGVSP